MPNTPSNIAQWHNPKPADIGEDFHEFIHILNEPTWITIPGVDKTRSRAIVTLLHGNEPSGLKAVHQLIKSELVPATNLGIFVASVNAALFPPMLSHRHLPHEKDLNRCFNPPFLTDQEKLAQNFLTLLEGFSPEAVVDTHNTSGHSEPFAVATRSDAYTRHICNIFTDKLVIIDQALGTLIEQRRGNTPIVTIEFGGFMDPKADALACESIKLFATMSNLFPSDITREIKVLNHPLRLELEPGHKLHYSSTVQETADITIYNTIDQLNFSHIEAGTSIGWLGNNGLSALRILTATGENLTDTYFIENEGFIETRKAITLFMATTDASIAMEDCLMYLTADPN